MDLITETDRLLIEKANLTDAPFFLELLTSPNWLQYIGDRGISTEEDAQEYIQKSLLGSYHKHGYGLYKVSLKSTKLPIGITGFVKRDYLDHADIGFAILPKYGRKGYTFEASQAIMAYGKVHLKLHPILGITTEENTASKSLLVKLGLNAIGEISPEKANGPLLLYSNERVTLYA
ncbi:MAG: GNAT family N-acetyltransferase [Bacteroidota bacterium]